MNPHPSSEDLLLLQSGELPAFDAECVSRHVAQCGYCRSRMAGFDGVLKTVAHANRSRHQPFSLQQRWLRGAIAAAAGVCLFLYLGTGTTSARVDTFLENGERRESFDAHRQVSFRTGSARCAAAPRQDGECRMMNAAFQRAGWEWNEALSLRAYRQWRSSLRHKKDEMEDKPGVVVLSTSTGEGALRKATLWVRTSDYHATSGRFEFTGMAPVEVSETAGTQPSIAPAREVPAAVAEAPMLHLAPAQAATGPAEAELDNAEIQVRIALRSLDADRGFETAVEREAGAVLVRGVVKDQARLSEIKRAVEAIAHARCLAITAEEEIRTQAPMPWMPRFDHTDSPLAVKRLRAAFPDPQTEQRFADGVIETARNLASLARAHDELAAVAPRQHGDEAAGALRDLQALQERHMATLARELAPLIGPVGTTRQTLPAAEALDLYRAVYSLIFLSGPESGTLENTLSLLRVALEAEEP